MEQISRIEQIYYELKGVARVQNHRVRLEMLNDYEPELLEIGGLRGSTIKGVLGFTVRDLIGDTPEEGVLNMTVEDLLNKTIDIPRESRSDYLMVLREWKRLKAESSRKVVRLDKFKGSAAAFKEWFVARDDNQVEAIFGKTYTPINPIEWEGSPADACRFALAVWGPGSEARLKGVFKRTDRAGAGFVMSQQLKFRERKTDREIKVPEILKVISRYQRIDNEAFLRDYPSLRLFQSTGYWDTKTKSEIPWVTKEEYEKEESTKLPSYCR